MKWFCLMVLAGFILVPNALAQKVPDVRAVLVTGLQENSDLPANMKGVQQILERSLAGRFKGYRLVGRGAQNIAVGKSGKITLPNKNAIDVNVTKVEAGKVHMAIQWQEGGKNLLKMSVKTGAVPTIIGGPKGNGGNQILLLQAK